jgi:hypothetical protein
VRKLIPWIRISAEILVLSLVVLVAVPQAQTALSRSIAWVSTGRLIFSSTAPTIAAPASNGGFGNTPSIGTQNGAANFLLNVGTGGAAWTGRVALPTAANRWSCAVVSPLPGATTKQSIAGDQTTSVLLYNYGTGLLTTAWDVSALLQVQCFAM